MSEIEQIKRSLIYLKAWWTSQKAEVSARMMTEKNQGVKIGFAAQVHALATHIGDLDRALEEGGVEITDDEVAAALREKFGPGAEAMMLADKLRVTEKD